MKIKVCGLTEEKNIQELVGLNIDFIGLNFYPPSKRYLEPKSNHHLLKVLQPIKTVGVFVNEDIQKLLDIYKSYSLDFVQLHGDEDEQYTKILDDHQIPYIKVFRVKNDKDLPLMRSFENASFFLFDTFTSAYGGSGHSFDWKILEKYKGQKPFMLSGGISPENVDLIKKIDHPLLFGVDINSKFEVRPGIKDVQKVDLFSLAF